MYEKNNKKFRRKRVQPVKKLGHEGKRENKKKFNVKKQASNG